MPSASLSPGWAPTARRAIREGLDYARIAKRCFDAYTERLLGLPRSRLGSPSVVE